MTDAGPAAAAPPSPLRWRMPIALLVVSMINWFDRSAMSLARSYDSGLMVVVAAGWINMLLLGLLHRRIGY